jgi:hypothetical protein
MTKRLSIVSGVVALLALGASAYFFYQRWYSTPESQLIAVKEGPSVGSATQPLNAEEVQRRVAAMFERVSRDPEHCGAPVVDADGQVIGLLDSSRAVHGQPDLAR